MQSFTLLLSKINLYFILHRTLSSKKFRNLQYRHQCKDNSGDIEGNIIRGIGGHALSHIGVSEKEETSFQCK